MNNCNYLGVRSHKCGLRFLALLILYSWNGTIGFGATGHKSDTDLFESPYVYLIRGDENFAKLALNYTHSVPSPDSMITIDVRPSSKKASDTLATSPQCFSITLSQPMSLRLIITDSIGTSLIAYDFPKLPAGSYTAGAKGWPDAIRDAIVNHADIHVYFAANQKYHSRYRFDVDEKVHLLRVKRTNFSTQ